MWRSVVDINCESLLRSSFVKWDTLQDFQRNSLFWGDPPSILAQTDSGKYEKIIGQSFQVNWEQHPTNFLVYILAFQSSKALENGEIWICFWLMHCQQDYMKACLQNHYGQWRSPAGHLNSWSEYQNLSLWKYLFFIADLIAYWNCWDTEVWSL